MSSELETLKIKYDELLKRHLSIESIGPLALENQKLRADLSLAIEALKHADFVLEGSVAIEVQSDAILDKREQALMSFLETLAKLKERK